MRSILSITMLTFRESIRSRTVIAVAIVLAALEIWFPMAMKGDGSEAGLAHTVVLYTLGIAFAVLCVTALCVSAAAVSSESKGRTLQLARVKPLRMWKLWLGKWIGLVAIFSIFLAFAFVGIWPRVRHAECLSTASEMIAPVLPPLEKQIEQVVAEAIKLGTVDEVALAAVRRDAKNRLPFATVTLPPGRSWLWRFDVPGGIAPGKRPGLLLTLESDAFSPPTKAICYLRDTAGNGAESKIDFAISDFSSREMRLFFDPGSLGSARQVELGVLNSGDEKASALMLQPRQGLFLLVPTSSLEANMVRAFLVMAPILALVVAIGLSSGALFSQPVAIFCAAGLLISVFASSLSADDPDMLEVGAESKPVRAMFERSAVNVTLVLQSVSKSAMSPSPLTRLSNAELVPGSEVRSSLLLNGMLLPLMLMALSSMAMAGKELPE